SWQQWMWGSAGLLMVANVVLVAYARSAYLALAVTSIVATVGITRRRVRIAAIGVLVTLMCGAIWFSPLITQRIELGLQEMRETHSSPVITPMGIRPVMWEITASIVRDSPLIGHGLGSFPEQYRTVVTQRYTGWKATLTADPHNQYLMLLAETGLLGLAAFAWFLFSAARQHVRGPFGVVGIALLLAWCLTSLFSSHFHTFNEGHLIAILLGVCLARESAHPSQSRSAELTAVRTA
ncbi:MAG TPA: O-antigen ligase family protein, partial [Burkholderiaceae bacterium]|nr:O-antigen ligase family protein [Burkholderiaceae bacterium]